jgi:hypothetical protein
MYKEHTYFAMQGYDTMKTDRKITPSEGVTFKLKIHPKTDKDKFFTDLINWFDGYKLKEDQEKITFKLQGATFNIRNSKSNLIRWFRRLQKLSNDHFNNWNINKFITN